MKKLLYLAVTAFAAWSMTACSEEKFDGTNGQIPQIADYESMIEVSVDQTTNRVTFKLNGAKGVYPLWIIEEGKTYSTNPEYSKIYAKAGDYSVDVKIGSRNGISDGVITKTFHIDNTVMDFSKYLTFLGNHGKEWRFDSQSVGHLGCGEPGTDGTNWWTAGVDEKAEVGLYDHYMTFGNDYSYNYYVGDTPAIYCNKGVTVYPDCVADATDDFNVYAEDSSSTYAFDVDGDDLYITFPAGTAFPYMADNSLYENPRYMVQDMTATKLELVAQCDGISWHYIFTSGAQVKKFSGFKYDSEFNLWKNGNISDPTFWYADSNWSQLADPAWSLDGATYSFSFPTGNSDQWQGQVHIESDIAINSATNYDFSCIINTNQDHPGVTVKVQMIGDDNVYFVADRVATAAYEDYIYYFSDLPGFDGTLKLCFDFGGGADGLEATIKNIVIKDHANDDGTVLPSDEPEDPGTTDDVEWNYNSPENLWIDCTKEVTFWYADSGWGQLADPEMTGSLDDNNFTLTFPQGNTDQWQGQMHINTNLATSADKKYDLRITFNGSQDHPGITVKFQQSDDDNVYYCADRIAAAAYEDCTFKLIGFEGMDLAATQLCLDFGGCGDGYEVTVKDIVIQEHAKEVEWNVNADTNLWANADTYVDSFWYAPGWSQIADPEWSLDGGAYTVLFSSATTDQWQAQMHINSDIEISSALTYDLQVVINTNCDHPGVTIKAQLNGDDNVFFTADRHATTAYEDCVVRYTNLPGFDGPFKFALDFGGNPDNCEVIIKDIILQVHE